jgi:hypothetical protein
MQHYVIKYVRDLQQVSDFLWVLPIPPPIKLTVDDIAEILLKVALNTITITRISMHNFEYTKDVITTNTDGRGSIYFLSIKLDANDRCKLIMYLWYNINIYSPCFCFFHFRKDVFNSIMMSRIGNKTAAKYVICKSTSLYFCDQNLVLKCWLSTDKNEMLLNRLVTSDSYIIQTVMFCVQ